MRAVRILILRIGTNLRCWFDIIIAETSHENEGHGDKCNNSATSTPHLPTYPLHTTPYTFPPNTSLPNTSPPNTSLPNTSPPNTSLPDTFPPSTSLFNTSSETTALLTTTFPPDYTTTTNFTSIVRCRPDCGPIKARHMREQLALCLLCSTLCFHVQCFAE